MNILVAIGIYSMVTVMQGDDNLSSYQPYLCLFNLKKLERYLDGMVKTCPSHIFSEIINQVQQTCQRTCKILTRSSQSNIIQFNEYCRSLKIEVNDETVIEKEINRECNTECSTAITCKLNIQLEDIMPVIYWLLDQDLCYCQKGQICELCKNKTTSTPKPLPVCTTKAVSTEEQKQNTATSPGYSATDKSDCTGIVVGVGFLGAVVGVIITLTLCIWWSRRKQPKKGFEGQAMTNKAYFTTGDENIDEVGSKSRQRSVIYSEINDDSTHGRPKISHVVPIIRDTEEKPNSASNDKNVYNHLNEEINEDDAHDYDHARPVPVQNNDTENGYGKLYKMAGISKSIPDEKRMSSSSMNHDYGELEIEETEGVKRRDNETKKTETDDIVGNGDNDNYFTLEKSHI